MSGMGIEYPENPMLFLASMCANELGLKGIMIGIYKCSCKVQALNSFEPSGL